MSLNRNPDENPEEKKLSGAKHSLIGGLATAAYAGLGSLYFHYSFFAEKGLSKILDSFCPPGSHESNALFIDSLSSELTNIDIATGYLANAFMWGAGGAIMSYGIKKIRDIKNKAVRYALLGALALGAGGTYTYSFIDRYNANTRLEERAQTDRQELSDQVNQEPSNLEGCQENGE